MKGEAIYFFAFDVANELQLDEARRRLVTDRRFQAPAAPPPAPRGLALSPPLSFPVENSTMLHGVPIQVDLRLFEFGAVSVVMRVPFRANDLEGLAPFLSPTLDGGRRLDQLARELCERACREAGPALVRPSPVGDPETYIVLRITDLDGQTDAEDWLAQRRIDVAALLTGVPAKAISGAQVDEVLRHCRSLTRADAVVPGWDAALVLDLAGSAGEVLFTIELANLQLEEFRQMDRVIDRFLDNAYADLERRTPSLLGTSTVLRKLRRFRVDLARLADEVTNTTKMFGDWHLARVYDSARERFHLDRWRQSVERRLAEVDQLYNLVRSEVADRRMFVLELIIAVLIVVELIVGFGVGR